VLKAQIERLKWTLASQFEVLENILFSLIIHTTATKYTQNYNNPQPNCLLTSQNKVLTHKLTLPYHWSLTKYELDCKVHITTNGLTVQLVGEQNRREKKVERIATRRRRAAEVSGRNFFALSKTQLRSKSLALPLFDSWPRPFPDVRACFTPDVSLT